MNTSRALHTMKGMQDAIQRFGVVVPRHEKDFLDGIVVKLENETTLTTKEQEFVDKNVNTVFDD